MIAIERVTDVLEDRRKRWSLPSGYPLSHYLPDDFDRLSGHVELDGEFVPAEKRDELLLRDGSVLLLADIPGFLFLPILTFFAVGLFAINMALSILNRPPTRSSGSPELPEGTSFARGVTTIGPGARVPLIFGNIRAYGHIIESFISSDYDVIPDSSTYITSLSGVGLPKAESAKLYSRVALCAGPVYSIEQIEVDGSPASYMSGISYQKLYGETVQPPAIGFDETKGETSVNQQLTVAGGAEVQTTSGPVDAIEVTLYFPNGLYEFDDDGNVLERQVDIAISYRVYGSGGGYTTYKTVSPSAGRRGPFTYQVRLPQLPREVYDVRCLRLTADNSDPNVVDDSYWSTMVEVLSAKSTFPGLAQLAFQHIPQIGSALPKSYSAEVAGFKDIRIYSTTTTYTLGWSDNPAWCWAHWVTDRENGLGAAYSYDDIDIQELIDWADHCDSTCSDGVGGTEVRCRFDAEIRDGMSVEELLAAFETAGEAFLIEEGGRWRIVIDKDDSPSQYFGDGSYVRGSLVSERSNAVDLPTKITLKFRNEDRNWSEDEAIVEDLTVKGGHANVEELYLPGVTRLSQALRVGVRRMRRYKYVRHRIEFEVSADGWMIRAGDIFRFASPTGNIGIASGRILNVDTTGLLLQLDQVVDLAVTTDYEITVRHEDGTIETQDLKYLTALDDPVSSDYVELDAGTSWSQPVRVGELYSIGLSGLSTEEFRCTQTVLREDGIRQIKAVRHVSSVYDDTTDATDGETHTIYGGGTNLEVDTIGVAVNRPTDSGGDTIPQWEFHVWWEKPADDQVWTYEVWMRKQGDERPRIVGVTPNLEIRFIEPVKSGATYEFTVYAVHPTGKRTAWNEYTQWDDIQIPS